MLLCEVAQMCPPDHFLPWKKLISWPGVPKDDGFRQGGPGLPFVVGVVRRRETSIDRPPPWQLTHFLEVVRGGRNPTTLYSLRKDCPTSSSVQRHTLCFSLFTLLFSLGARSSCPASYLQWLLQFLGLLLALFSIGTASNMATNSWENNLLENQQTVSSTFFVFLFECCPSILVVLSRWSAQVSQ